MADRATDPNPAARDRRSHDSEKAGFSYRHTLRSARMPSKVEECTLERRKWWKLPVVGDVGVSESDNSDNSDKVY